jgi:YVTN family beta-propeller protein
MQSSNLSGNRSSKANCFGIPWAILAIGWGAMAWPGEARAWTGQPLAYVTSSAGISVIDTGDNEVVDTIHTSSSSVAVATDGKHIYVFGPSTSDFVFNISVIDATNDSVVATIPLDVSLIPDGRTLNETSGAIAVTPDGKHIYATTGICPIFDFPGCGTPEDYYFGLWEIDAVTNKVVGANMPFVGDDSNAGKGLADGIAFTPDGQRTYFTDFDPYTDIPEVAVFAPMNVIPLPASGYVYAIAMAPDGRHAYVPYVTLMNGPVENVAIIDTATNTIVKTVLVANTGATSPGGVAVTPDGKYVYVTNGINGVAVIDTASNTVVKTVLVGTNPGGVAVTPDGKHVYVANQGSNGVSVIDTANLTVVATVSVTGPGVISIIPPPQAVPFQSFSARLDIDLGRKPNHSSFDLRSSFILSSTAKNEIHPDTEPVKLQVGPFIATIPAGSFRRREEGSYSFAGVIDEVRLEAKVEPRGGFRYEFQAEAKGANLSGTTNPVQVSLGIGENAGVTSVNAHFDRDRDHETGDHWGERFFR